MNIKFGTICVVICTVMLMAIPGFADETTYIVKLREKIITDIKCLQSVHKESEESRTRIASNLSRLEDAFMSAETEEQKNQVKRKYREAKTRLIEVDAHWVTGKLKYIKSLNSNLRLLNDEYIKEGQKDGLGLNDNDIKLVQDTLVGLDKSLAVIKGMNPDNSHDVAMLEGILVTADSTYKNRFRSGDLAKLEGIMERLREMETYFEGLKRYLKVVVQGERVRVYNGLTKEIADELNDSLKTGDFDLPKRYKLLNNGEEKMYGKSDDFRVSTSGNSPIGQDTIGRW